MEYWEPSQWLTSTLCLWEVGCVLGMTDVDADAVHDFTFGCLFSSMQWITCILGNKNAKRSMASDISVSVDLVS